MQKKVSFFSLLLAFEVSVLKKQEKAKIPSENNTKQQQKRDKIVYKKNLWIYPQPLLLRTRIDDDDEIINGQHLFIICLARL